MYVEAPFTFDIGGSSNTYLASIFSKNGSSFIVFDLKACRHPFGLVLPVNREGVHVRQLDYITVVRMLETSLLSRDRNERFEPISCAHTESASPNDASEVEFVHNSVSTISSSHEDGKSVPPTTYRFSLKRPPKIYMCVSLLRWPPPSSRPRSRSIVQLGRGGRHLRPNFGEPLDGGSQLGLHNRREERTGRLVTRARRELWHRHDHPLGKGLIRATRG